MLKPFAQAFAGSTSCMMIMLISDESRALLSRSIKDYFVYNEKNTCPVLITGSEMLIYGDSDNANRYCLISKSFALPSLP